MTSSPGGNCAEHLDVEAASQILLFAVCAAFVFLMQMMRPNVSTWVLSHPTDDPCL